MVVENIRICGIQMENGFASQENESRHSDKDKTLFPVSIITPKAKTSYSFPQLKGRTMKTYFKMKCFKPTFKNI